MSKYVFFYKDNEEDRDSVKYLDIEDLNNKHVACDGKFNLNGACFSMSFNGDEDFDEITTVLTKEEFQTLANYSDNQKDITSIINKLNSKENQDLFAKIIEEEKEYLQNEYNLSDEDLNYIYDNYSLSYQDRGILSTVFDTIEEAGEEYYDNTESTSNDRLKAYIDFEKYGNDLLDSEFYLELPSGRIAYLNC